MAAAAGAATLAAAGAAVGTSDAFMALLLLPVYIACSQAHDDTKYDNRNIIGHAIPPVP